MRVRSILPACVIVAGFIATASATPIELPIVTGSSSVNVQLCILGGCDSDPSSVSGFIRAKISPLGGPMSLQLYDFTFILNDQIDLYISFSILGSFTGTGQNIVLSYATPGTPQPPTAVSSGAFSYTGVPTNATGTIHYVATGIVCSAIQPTRPCVDTVNLADQGTQNGDLNGNVTVSPARVVAIQLNPNVSGPIDPNNPSLGTLTVTGTIVANAAVPLRGDANQDGVVDARDIGPFMDVLLNPAAATWQGRFIVDMNDDDGFDVLDAEALANCLVTGGNCE